MLSRMFRLGRSTVNIIIDETCPAIYAILKDEYLTVCTNISLLHYSRFCHNLSLIPLLLNHPTNN